MMSRTTMLRRKPEEPQRATFLELFFDLAFVYALFQLSHGLLAHLGWSGAFHTAVLLLAVWLVWSSTTRISNRYDLGRSAIQLLVIGSMFGAAVLAAAVPDAFSTRGPLFAGAYVAVQVGRSLFLVVITRGERRPEWLPELRLLFWFGVSALPWLAGAVVHGWARGVLWALAVTVDYILFGLGWPTPGLGRASGAEFAVSGEFLAERQRQFVIIALGELILVTGLTFTSSGFGAGREAAAVVAFATAALLWRVYIYRAGEILGAAVAAAPEPPRVGIASMYAHLAMVAGLVAISAGDELVIRHPAGHIHPPWIAVIFGGPALFLAGRAGFEYLVFSRVSPDRVIGVLVLAAVFPAMVFAPPLLAAVAAAVVLAGVAIADTARARRHLASRHRHAQAGHRGIAEATRARRYRNWRSSCYQSEGAEQCDELADLVGGREVRCRIAEGAAVRQLHPGYQQCMFGHPGSEYLDLQDDWAVEAQRPDRAAVGERLRHLLLDPVAGLVRMQQRRRAGA
jgi:low temperature requirement protein LtrA